MATTQQAAHLFKSQRQIGGGFFQLIGNARDNFAPYISNGETAVFVRAHSEADVELAAGTIRQYAPIRIDVGWVEEGAARAHKLL